MIRSAALSSSGALPPFLMNLMAIGQASAASPNDNYKALVCVYLEGGNDHYNTVVPYDEKSYALYKQLRPELALSRSALLPLPPLPNPQPGRVSQYALNPNLAGLKQLFDKQKMAVLLNVGTLLEPVKKSTIDSAELPPKLFSHNDQRDFWQSLEPDGAKSGWGGRISQSLQPASTLTFNQQLFSSVMVTEDESGGWCFNDGSDVMASPSLDSFSIRFSGTSSPYNAYGMPIPDSVVEAVTTQTSNSVTNLIQADYIDVTKRSHAAHRVLSATLEKNADADAKFQSNPLVRKLRMVARFIKARGTLGLKRQVFFVSMSGFDTHSGQSVGNSLHAGLLRQLSEGLTDFYEQTRALGIEDQVTTFTASDFGRSWGNGDGSDHGWGSHYFVMGGAVKGGQFFGTSPHVTGRDDGDDNYRNGILIPTSSVDQVAATMAAWMGVSRESRKAVFPRLENFPRQNLGFMMTEAMAPSSGKTYVICAKHSGLALSLESINTNNGTRVVQKNVNPNDRSQKWQLEAAGDAFFFKNLASGLVLDVSGHLNNEGLPVDISGNGQVIYQWTTHGGANQRFRIEQIDRGNFRIVEVHSGKVVDISRQLKTEGAPAIQYAFHGGPNQLFSFDEVSP
jgi:uncharacterized protein (DUF1501 family)